MWAFCEGDGGARSSVDFLCSNLMAYRFIRCVKPTVERCASFAPTQTVGEFYCSFKNNSGMQTLNAPSHPLLETYSNYYCNGMEECRNPGVGTEPTPTLCVFSSSRFDRMIAPFRSRCGKVFRLFLLPQAALIGRREFRPSIGQSTARRCSSY